MVTKYQKGISGSLLDRIDIHIEAPRVDYEKLDGDRMGERPASRFASMYRRHAIFNNNTLLVRSPTSSAMPICPSGETRQFCQLQAEGQSLMRAAMTQLNLSAHIYHRVLKLAREIADLAGSEQIQSAYLVERATTVATEVVNEENAHR